MMKENHIKDIFFCLKALIFTFMCWAAYLNADRKFFSIFSVLILVFIMAEYIVLRILKIKVNRVKNRNMKLLAFILIAVAALTLILFGENNKIWFLVFWIISLIALFLDKKYQ